MRVIGPNCLGIIYAADGGAGINTFFIPEEKFKVNFGKKRNVAILSQSGAMGIMELYNLRNAISPKVVVSYGISWTWTPRTSSSISKAIRT
jgi:acyl-CoA synthetase (NDP forming)